MNYGTSSDWRELSVKEISKLEKKRYRDELGIFLVEGKKVFEEAIGANLEMLQVLVTGTFQKENKDYLSKLGFYKHNLTIIADHSAEQIAGTKTPQGIFAVIRKPEVSFEDLLQSNEVVVFENVRDPGNLGTMLRTADWFGITSVMVSNEGVDPYNDKVIRSTMGSLFHMKIYSSVDLEGDLQMLKENGHKVIVTRPEEGVSTLPEKPSKYCLVMGNESRGTSKEVDRLADEFFTIPKYGQAESLNVAISFGIIVHELKK